MYLDDGESRSSADANSHPVDFGGDEQAKNEYRQTKITHSYTGEKTRVIKVERVVHDNYTPPNNYTPKFENYFFVAVLHDPSENKGGSGCLKSIKIAGKEINLVTGGTPDQRSEALRASSSNAWYYNENINISFIKVFDDSPSIAITAEMA